MVNGYWFPSLAAAAEAPAGEGFDFAKAAAEAAMEAALAKEEMKVFWLLASACRNEARAGYRRRGGCPASSRAGGAGAGMQANSTGFMCTVVFVWQKPRFIVHRVLHGVKHRF